MYEFNVRVNLPADKAEERLREALMAEKLGVVSEINVQAIMKTKLDKEIGPYKILGACNPMLASRVLESQPNAGALLPCNVVVRGEGDATVISFMDPNAVLGLADDEVLNQVAGEAKAILERVAAAVAA